MGKVHDGIDARMARWIERQPVFFVATAPLTADGLSLQVEVFPAKVGNNSIHLYAYTPDNKPLPVVEWTATAALPANGIEPIEIPLLRITDFHAVGDIALPAAGDWTMKFTVRTSDIDQSTVSMTVKVS